MRSCPSSTYTRSRKRAVVRHAEIVLDGGSCRSKVVPEPTARFPGTVKRRRREDQGGSHRKKWRISMCRRVYVYVFVCVWDTSRWRRCACCLLPGTMLTNDAWRRSATRRLIDATVTSRAARPLCISLADFSLHATAWRRYSLNARVSACNPPCF